MTRDRRHVSPFADLALQRVVWARAEHEMKLAEVLDTRAGMSKPYTFEELTATVTSSYELDVCPDEAGPAIHDQYENFTFKGWQPIASPEAFCVYWDKSGIVLDTARPFPDGKFSLGTRWLFALRKRASS
jgi:hypothetical protein